MPALARHVPPDPAKKREWLLLCGSVALNILLLFGILSRSPSAPSDARGPASTTSRSAPPAPTGQPSAPTAAPSVFRWEHVDSADHRQFVASLRQAGCPELTIEDLLRARLNRDYMISMEEIWRPTPRAYWQKARRDQPGPAERERLQVITDQKQRELRALLGNVPPEQSWADLVLFQLQGSERQLMFLPKERQAAALAALRDSGHEEKEGRLAEQRVSQEQMRALFAEKLQLLSVVLSPAELEEFNLRHSPAANDLRTEIQFFECSPAEFKLLLEAREQGGADWGNLLDRTEAEAAVAQLLGSERARQFAMVSDLFYLSARRTAEENGLPVDVATRVYDLTRAARDKGKQIADEPGLPPESKATQLRLLREETEAQLVTQLGIHASALVRDLRTVLAGYERRAKQ